MRGCRPNSNYLPASIMLGEGITHVQNTHVNCKVCRHTKHVHEVVCAHAHIHTHTHCSQTRTSNRHTVHTQQVSTDTLETHKGDTASRDYQPCHRHMKEPSLRFFHVSMSIHNSWQAFGKGRRQFVPVHHGAPMQKTILKVND